LSDAQRIALTQYPDLKSARYDEFAADEAVKIAHSAYEPQVYGAAVQAFAGPQTRVSSYGGLNDPTIIQRTALGVAVSQNITDFGRTTALMQASELEREVQRNREKITRDTVLLNVTRAYFEVLRANALLTVARKTRSERGTLLSQVTALQRAGLRSTLDISTMQRDVSEADQLVLEARGRLEDAFAALAEAMGTPSVHAYALQDVQRLPPLPSDIEEALQTAMRENPALASTQAQERALRKRSEAIDRSTLPTVTGYGFFGATPIRAENQPIASSYATAGIALTVPVFNGGALAAEKRQAADATLAASEDVNAARERLTRDVRIVFESVKTSRGNIDVSKQILVTAQQTLELTRARYRIGLNSIVDLSQAQLSATQAAIGQTNAIYDYILRHVELDFATGILARSVL
jgi:outer membrane protein